MIFQKQSDGIPDPLYPFTDLLKKNRKATQKKPANRQPLSFNTFQRLFQKVE